MFTMFYEKVNQLDNINTNLIFYLHTHTHTKNNSIKKKHINKINYILNKKMFLNHSS